MIMLIQEAEEEEEQEDLAVLDASHAVKPVTCPENVQTKTNKDLMVEAAKDPDNQEKKVLMEEDLRGSRTMIDQMTNQE